MRKKTAFFALALCFSLRSQPGFSVEIDRDELKTAAGKVEFESNKTLPPADAWNTTDQIRAIGAQLAEALLREKGKPYIVVGDRKRYLLKEVVPERPRGGFLSADILELGPQAGVDSIRNLRLILSGYLEVAYTYDRPYADELALYISVYNALNREKLERFIERYSKQVVSQLKKNKVGLSRSYREWPGRTQIVIPLFDEDDDGEAFVELVTILEKEVIAAVEKEKPGSTTAPESIVVKERNAARTAKEEAEKKRQNLGGAMKKTQEKQNDLGPRIAKLEEEVAAMKIDLAKAQRDVVKNKFGQPIQGNETAKKIEDELKRRTELLQRLQTDLQTTTTSLHELEQQFQEADAEAARRSADLERMGAL